MKHFILTTTILLILLSIMLIRWFSKSHNYSWYGFKNWDGWAITYSIYLRAYLFGWIGYLIITKFIPWYDKL